MSDSYSATGVALRALLEILDSTTDETIQGIVTWLMQNRKG